MQDPKPSRTIYCQDALSWLKQQECISGVSIITSLPDYSEFPSMTLEEWKEWFIEAAYLVLTRCPSEGVSIFYQTDIKQEGAWVDKAFLCLKAAERAGHALLWHKIVARSQAGSVSFGRPGYSHLLCFSKNIRLQLSQSTADILPEAGDTTWTRGTGIKACQAACSFILKHTQTRTVLDPFCGHGTVLAVANELGLNAIGIELSRKRVKKARALHTVNGQIEKADRQPNTPPE